ncbi:MAG: TonB-dependent receptor plug domain-containing protein, partial [Segetibacter sp.]
SIPGLRVQSISGQPGVAPRVILRGGTSINNPNGAGPLYLVDGVIRPNINDIAAEDIESVQVLKDAASTAIYGARASNGVILVTTKSAKAGTTRISYSYDLSLVDEGNRDLVYTNAREYIQYARQSVLWTGVKLPASTTNSRLTAPTGYGTGNDLTNRTAFTTQYLTPQNEYKLKEGWESMPDPADPTKTIIFKDTDFQKLRFRTAKNHNHYLTVSGGTEKAKFNGGVGYLLGQGTALNSDYKRLSVNFNSSIQVTRKINVTGRVLYSNTDFHFINAAPATQFTVLANTFYRSASLPSTAKYQFEDGTIAPGQAASAGNPHYYQIGPFAPQTSNNAQKLTLSLAGKWDILPGLSFEPLVSSYEEEGFGRSFQPAFLSTVTTLNTLRSASQSYSTSRSYQADAVLTYVKSIANHNFEVKGGYSYFD